MARYYTNGIKSGEVYDFDNTSGQQQVVLGDQFLVYTYYFPELLTKATCLYNWSIITNRKAAQLIAAPSRRLVVRIAKRDFASQIISISACKIRDPFSKFVPICSFFYTSILHSLGWNKCEFRVSTIYKVKSIPFVDKFPLPYRFVWVLCSPIVRLKFPSVIQGNNMCKLETDHQAQTAVDLKYCQSHKLLRFSVSVVSRHYFNFLSNFNNNRFISIRS